MKIFLLLHSLKFQEFSILFNSRFQSDASKNKQAIPPTHTPKFMDFLNSISGPQFYLLRTLGLEESAKISFGARGLCSRSQTSDFSPHFIHTWVTLNIKVELGFTRLKIIPIPWGYKDQILVNKMPMTGGIFFY